MVVSSEVAQNNRDNFQAMLTDLLDVNKDKGLHLATEIVNNITDTVMVNMKLNEIAMEYEVILSFMTINKFDNWEFMSEILLRELVVMFVEHHQSKNS